MNKESEARSMTKEPVYPPRDVTDIILQILPDPGCHRPNCHGRGYVGIIQNKNGSQTVLLCSCAQYGETDYVRAMKRLDDVNLHLDALMHKISAQSFRILLVRNRLIIMDGNIDRVFSHTLFGSIKTLWRAIFKKGGAIQAEAVDREDIQE
jgi:hypothetical protein